jgi:hypothetical protein
VGCRARLHGPHRALGAQLHGHRQRGAAYQRCWFAVGLNAHLRARIVVARQGSCLLWQHVPGLSICIDVPSRLLSMCVPAGLRQVDVPEQLPALFRRDQGALPPPAAHLQLRHGAGRAHRYGATWQTALPCFWSRFSWPAQFVGGKQLTWPCCATAGSTVHQDH